MRYYVKSQVMDSYLIEHYGFKAIPWSDKYNLEYRDEDRFGLEVVSRWRIC